MQEIENIFNAKIKRWILANQLNEESSLLCTFSTLFGQYRFTRMPFIIINLPAKK